MSEPATPAEERRHGLNRSRWVATGAAVGVAAVRGGTIAMVNAAPSASSDSNRVIRTGNGIGDDEYEPAEPFQPQTQSPTQQPQQTPQFTPQFQPGTRSGGS